mmetsp:Transcript_22441/g.89999  ORF Transcript_22441/g.89999 Transcript_22441/m.89999 type:complete len:97 (-) Transcript_22441:125-415(-)
MNNRLVSSYHPIQHNHCAGKPQGDHREQKLATTSTSAPGSQLETRSSLSAKTWNINMKMAKNRRKDDPRKKERKRTPQGGETPPTTHPYVPEKKKR